MSITDLKSTMITKPTGRTSTSWAIGDDLALRFFKEVVQLGWKEIAANFRFRTPNACQFRWRRLRSGNLRSSAAATFSKTDIVQTLYRFQCQGRLENLIEKIDFSQFDVEPVENIQMDITESVPVLVHSHGNPKEKTFQLETSEYRYNHFSLVNGDKPNNSRAVGSAPSNRVYRDLHLGSTLNNPDNQNGDDENVGFVPRVFVRSQRQPRYPIYSQNRFRSARSLVSLNSKVEAKLDRSGPRHLNMNITSNTLKAENQTDKTVLKRTPLRELDQENARILPIPVLESSTIRQPDLRMNIYNARFEDTTIKINHSNQSYPSKLSNYAGQHRKMLANDFRRVLSVKKETPQQLMPKNNSTIAIIQNSTLSRIQDNATSVNMDDSLCASKNWSQREEMILLHKYFTFGYINASICGALPDRSYFEIKNHLSRLLKEHHPIPTIRLAKCVNQGRPVRFNTSPYHECKVSESKQQSVSQTVRVP